MTVREYIGARYVPLFIGEWNSENAYEPLSVVSYQGNSYTSRQAVPVGIPITNETYWVVSGNYNAQVEAYRQEVRTFDSRITANADAIEQERDERKDDFNAAEDDIEAEKTARQNADTALQNAITAEETSRQNADTTLSNDVSALDSDLQAEITARKNADTALQNAIEVAKRDVIQNYHKTTYDNTLWTYVDAINGNDSTAQIMNSRKPFRTLEAAFEAVSNVGNDLRFMFMSGGTYILPCRIIIGSVLHLFQHQNASDVTVVTKCDYGNFFAYDCHINLRSDNPQSRINFVVGEAGKDSRNFEIEGSTLWTNRANITCDRLYMIQGSASIANTTFNSVSTPTSANLDSFLDLWFALVRFFNVTINNKSDMHALHLMVGKLRVENQPFHIETNANVTDSKSAVYLQDSTIRLNNDFQIGNNSRYGYALQANSSIIFGSDVYYNAWGSQTSSGNSVGDGTIRSKLANEIPV